MGEEIDVFEVGGSEDREGGLFHHGVSQGNVVGPEGVTVGLVTN